MHRPRLFARPLFFTMAFAGLAATAALFGCELAVNPDVALAEVPAPVCVPCLDASETVITEPDGNVIILPTDSLDGSAEAGDDDDAEASTDDDAGDAATGK